MRSSAFLLVCVLALQSGTAIAQSTGDTIATVQPKIVKIFGAGGVQSLAAYGTGFLVSKEGHIVTVWSHVLDPDQVIVVLDDGRRFAATVLGAEPQLDLAVLKIEPENSDVELSVPHFDLNTVIGNATAGARVLGFSNMFKVATGDEQVSVLHGVVAAKAKLRARRGTYQIPYDGLVYIVDAITNNSGGAGGLLVTRDGKLLGMIGRELRNSETNTWVNYSIPLTELKEPIEEIISGTFKSKPNPADSPDAVARYVTTDFGIVMIPDVLFRTPAFVDSVVANSAAAKAGVKPDDLVLFVNDELQQSVRTLGKEIGRLEAGDTLRMVVRRDDELLTFEFAVPKSKVKPAAKKDDE
jgi:serine protease Do